MRFQLIEQSVDGNQTCDFEHGPAYHCGREANHEVRDPQGWSGDFEWCEYRCPLHAVEAFQPGTEGTIEHDEETDGPVCVQSFVAYGWRKDWGYVVWRGDSREGGWVAVKDPMDRDTAVELLGKSVDRAMGY